MAFTHPLAALFQLSDAMQVITDCAVRGYQFMRAPMAIHLTVFWVFPLPPGFVLGCALHWAPLAPARIAV